MDAINDGQSCYYDAFHFFQLGRPSFRVQTSTTQILPNKSQSVITETYDTTLTFVDDYHYRNK